MDKFEQKIKEEYENQDVPTEKVFAAIENGMKQAPKRRSVWKKKPILAVALALVIGISGGITLQSLNAPTLNNDASKMSTMTETAENKGNDSGVVTSDGMTPELTQNPNAKMITTVSLTLESKGFQKSLNSIDSIVSEAKGYTESSNFYGKSSANKYGFMMEPPNEMEPNKKGESVELVLRIPQDEVNKVVKKLETTGHVLTKNVMNQDVSLSYQDSESRKKVLTTEQDKLMDLLTKAENIDETIALEKRLSEIQLELENIESQLRSFDNQVNYATIYLELKNVSKYTEPNDGSVWVRIRDGFMANAVALKVFLINVFVWLLANSLSLIVVGLVIGGCYVAYKKWIKK